MIVDYICSHTCPTSIIEGMYSNIIPCVVSKFLDHIREITTYKHWYFGHFHLDEKLDEKHTCLYDNILELEY
jgi:hypothetical protein